MLTTATGSAERDAAEAMLGRQPGRHRASLGADKAYDTAGLVAGLRALNVTPHVAQNTSGRRSAIGARTTRHPGYVDSQRVRKRIEEACELDQDGGRPQEGPASRHGPGRLAVHADRDRLQPGAAAQAAGGRLTMPALRPEASEADISRPPPRPRNARRGPV